MHTQVSIDRIHNNSAPIINEDVITEIKKVFDYEHRDANDFAEYNTMELRKVSLKCNDGKDRDFLVGFHTLPIGIDWNYKDYVRYHWFGNAVTDNHDDYSNNMMIAIDYETRARYYYVDEEH